MPLFVVTVFVFPVLTGRRDTSVCGVSVQPPGRRGGAAPRRR